MQTQEVSFTVTKQDYRAANYYIHFMSRTLFLYVTAGTVILFLAYRMLVEAGVIGYWEPSLYITSFALFWILLQITKLETTVRRYARSPENILGKKSILRYTDTRMTMKIPEKAFSSSGLFAEYPAAFETRRLFLVYTSGSDLFLIPRRAFTKEKLETFRNILINAMGDRLSSRYNKHAPHIPTAAEIEAEQIKQTQAEEEAAAKEAEKAHKLAVREAKKEGRDLEAEEARAAEEAAAVVGPNFKPRRRSIADRANLVNNREKNAEKKPK